MTKTKTRNLIIGSTAAIILLVVGVLYYLGFFESHASTLNTQYVSNSASISYCSEGDTSCQPNSNTYSGTSSSNVVKTEVLADVPANSPSPTTQTGGTGGTSGTKSNVNPPTTQSTVTQTANSGSDSSTAPTNPAPSPTSAPSAPVVVAPVIKQLKKLTVRQRAQLRTWQYLLGIDNARVSYYGRLISNTRDREANYQRVLARPNLNRYLKRYYQSLSNSAVRREGSYQRSQTYYQKMADYRQNYIFNTFYE